MLLQCMLFQTSQQAFQIAFPHPASNNNAEEKCTVFFLVGSEMRDCEIPSGAWHTFSQKQQLASSVSMMKEQKTLQKT